MRTEKGQPGYVKARKQKYLLGAVVEFAIVIAIFVTGYIPVSYTHLRAHETESAYRCSGSRMPSGSKDVGGIYHNGTI